MGAMAGEGFLVDDGPYRSLVDERRPARAPAIECCDIVHSFGSKKVLCGVSFEVPRGSVYGFIGPNGAGKTTTLRILATMLDPTSGTARIAGYDVTSHPERVRRILGYMPDSSGIKERVTVGEYLDFWASAHGLHGDARTGAVERTLELTEMAALRPVLATTLSKGQRQRLLLARTLLHDPEVLLLDEPASDLDPRARIELRKLLATLGRMGKTILLSSHILSELAELCDSVAVLEGGRIVVAGAIGEVQGRVRPGRRVRIRVLAQRDEAVALVRSLPGCTLTEAVDAEPAGATDLRITCDGDERAVAELVGSLARGGVPLCAVEPERADLERIFMQVTDRTGEGRA
jgi:ABC-2 type transport system ATP-binding protein